MNLLSQLNEAAAISPAELKAAMQKDPRTKQIFTRSFDPAGVNSKVLMQSLKFYFFNNQLVLQWVKDVGMQRNFSAWDFNKLRKVAPEKATADNISDAVEVIKGFFKTVGLLDRKNADKATLENVYHALSRDTRAAHLNSVSIKELKAIDGIRHDHPVRLYAGINFSERDFEDTYQQLAGQTTMGQGAAVHFLNSIRKGKRIVDLETQGPTVWTNSLEAAIDSARFGDFGGRYRDKNDRMVGRLGFVISVLAKPEDVLVDAQLALDTKLLVVSTSVTHKSILDAGTYRCRLVKKFLPDGEVDLDATDDEGGAEAEAAAIASQIAFVLKMLDKKLPPFAANAVVRTFQGQISYVKDNGLVDEVNRQKIAKVFEWLRDFIRDEVAQMDFAKMQNVLGVKYAKFFNYLQSMREEIQRVSIPQQNAPARRAAGGPQMDRLLDLTGEEVLKRFPASINIKDSFYYLVNNKRFTDWSVGFEINNMLRVVTGKDTGQKLHLMGREAQQVHLKRAYTELLKFLDLPVGADIVQSAKDAMPQIDAALRASGLAEFMSDVRRNMRSALETL